MGHLRQTIELFGRHFPGVTLVTISGAASNGDYALAYRTAETEYRGQHARQSDTQQPDHLRIARAGAQDAAERRMFQEQPQADQHAGRGRQDGDAVLGDQDRPPDVEA